MIGIIISVLILGIDTWKEYLTAVSGKMGQLPEMGHTAYQTINSFLLHLFAYDPKWLPHPLLILPDNIVFILSICISLLFIFYIVFDSKPDEQFFPLSFSAAIAAGVVTAPVAEEYHYLLFLPLTIGISKILFEQFSVKKAFGAADIFFLASVLIMILPLNYKSLQFSSAPLYLIAYPKLYAGIILLIIYKRIIRLHKAQT